jgi:hypothetical protein
MNAKETTDRILKKYFFQPAASQSLSLFRFLYCSLLIWRILGDSDAHLTLFDSATWNPIPLFEWFGVGLMEKSTFQALQYLLLGALVLTALGAFTRVAAHVAWVAFFLYMGTYLGFTKAAGSSYVYHSKNIVVFILFILAISPGVAVWGLDGWRKRGWKWRPLDVSQAYISNWPSQLIKLTLGLAYFGSGYCKHLLWADGHTLQAYLISKHLLLGEGTEWGLWLSQHYWLCLLLGIGTIILELTFFLVVFFPRLTWPYVVSGLSFHTMIWLTMRISFFPYFGFVYVIFLDWPTVTRLASPFQWAWNALRGHRAIAIPRTLAEQLTGSVQQLVSGDTRSARRAILGMSGLLFFCVIARVECWPFTDYRVFQSRFHVSKVRVFRFAAVMSDGSMQWIERADHPVSPTAINFRCREGETEQLKAIDDVKANLIRLGKEDVMGVVLIERTVRGDSVSGELAVVDRRLLEGPLFEFENYATNASLPDDSEASMEFEERDEIALETSDLDRTEMF